MTVMTAKRNRRDYFRHYMRAKRGSLPRQHSPVRPVRIHYTADRWRRRVEHMQRSGMYPDRLRNLDDKAMVEALRRERKRVLS